MNNLSSETSIFFQKFSIVWIHASVKYLFREYYNIRYDKNILSLEEGILSSSAGDLVIGI